MARKLFTLLGALLVASAAFGAGDWSRTNTEVLVTDQVRDSYEFRADSAETSEDLDMRRFTGGALYKFDPSVTDNSTNAVAQIYDCPSAGVAIASCTLRTTLSSANQRWTTGDDATGGLGGFPFAFLRVVFTVTPAGGDVAAVHVEGLQPAASRVREEAVLFDTYNHTLLDFQHVRDTACADVLCTPNDVLTPTWIRGTDIGVPIAPAFALSSTYGLSGEASLDPGTAASTGVQVQLPATQSLILNYADVGRYENRRYAFRATFYRTGTTVIPAFGLCLINSSNVATPMLTTAGALNVTNQWAMVWNASGTFTIANGGAGVTTAQTYDANYHELTIRSVKRNIGLDITNLHLPSGTVADAVVLEIDGVKQFEIPFSGLTIDVGATQMVPCIAAVNVGGTADVLRIADVEWHTPKARPIPDTN